MYYLTSNPRVSEEPDLPAGYCGGFEERSGDLDWARKTFLWNDEQPPKYRAIHYLEDSRCNEAEKDTYEKFIAIYEQVIARRTDHSVLQATPLTHVQAVAQGATLSKALISLLYKKEFTIRGDADIRLAVIFLANLVCLANYTGILERASKMIEEYLFSRDELWADVSGEPLFYLGLGLRLESKPIFEEAMMHIVGKESLSGESSYSNLPFSWDVTFALLEIVRDMRQQVENHVFELNQSLVTTIREGPQCSTMHCPIVPGQSPQRSTFRRMIHRFFGITCQVRKILHLYYEPKRHANASSEIEKASVVGRWMMSQLVLKRLWQPALNEYHEGAHLPIGDAAHNYRLLYESLSSQNPDLLEEGCVGHAAQMFGLDKATLQEAIVHISSRLKERFDRNPLFRHCNHLRDYDWPHDSSGKPCNPSPCNHYDEGERDWDWNGEDQCNRSRFEAKDHFTYYTNYGRYSTLPHFHEVYDKWIPTAAEDEASKDPIPTQPAPADLLQAIESLRKQPSPTSMAEPSAPVPNWGSGASSGWPFKRQLTGTTY